MSCSLYKDLFLTGRLIDQLLPTSVHNPEEASIVHQFRATRGSQFSHLQEGKYTYATVWGNTLPLWNKVRQTFLIIVRS